MRVALVSPASGYASYGVPDREADPPMGLLSLAGHLDAAGFETRIFDGQLSTARPERLAQTILAWRPDLVGFSINFSTVLAAARKMAATIRRAAPEVKILVGGNYATFNWARLAREPFVDAVALHEAEGYIVELASRLGEGGPLPGGVVDGRGPRPDRTPAAPFLTDLDALPWSDFSLFDDHRRYVKTIVSSRGCPYACVYCSTRKMWDGWRARSAASVVGEMKMLAKRFGAERVLFADDIFMVRRRRVAEMLQSLEEAALGLSWGFSTRLETLDEDMIPALARAGVTGIFLGIESGSERVLSSMRRRYTPQEVLRKVSLCAQHGITCTTSFILGLPWETEDDVRQTFSLMNAVETHRVLLNIFTPLAGTPALEDPGALGMTIIGDPDPEKAVVGHGRVQHATRHLDSKRIQRLWLEGQAIVMEKSRTKSADTGRASRTYGRMGTEAQS